MQSKDWTEKDFCEHIRSPDFAQAGPGQVLETEDFQQMVDKFLTAWQLVREHPRCELSPLYIHIREKETEVTKSIDTLTA